MEKVKVLAMMLAFVMSCLGFVACASGNEQDFAMGDELDPEGIIIGVKITIDYPDEAPIEDVVEYEILVPEGATVFEMLEAYKEETNLILAYEKKSYTYVTNIGGISEKDYGETCGWVFEKNDEMVIEDAAVCTLAEGDSIVWKYIDWSGMTM